VDVSTIANVATAITVITGGIFGWFEVRHFRREREERAAFELLHAMLTTEWLRSAVLVDSVPDDVEGEILESDARLLDAAQSIALILEALGYAVYARIIPLHMVDDIMGGIIRVTWRKMRVYVAHDRARSGSQKGWEWFQWLYEQLERHNISQTSLKRGAFVAFRDWKP
jgi:ABC-type siderophore export system fused ATPase/permease subunit